MALFTFTEAESQAIGVGVPLGVPSTSVIDRLVVVKSNGTCSVAVKSSPAFAVGGSSTAVTVKVASSEADSWVPVSSVAVKVMVSLPFQFSSGTDIVTTFTPLMETQKQLLMVEEATESCISEEMEQEAQILDTQWVQGIIIIQLKIL